MIGYLYGQVIDKKPPQIMLDVQNVGYELEAPMSTFAHVPEVNHFVKLYTHLLIREDQQLLFGFSDLHQRSLFRSLIRVSGVGAKMAIAILSSIEPDEFARCVQDDDIQTLTRMPGIGRKVAQKLVIEMRDKVKDWPQKTTNDSASVDSAVTHEISSSASEEATEALVALGYKPAEAKRAVAKAAQQTPQGEQNSDAEKLIRQALKGVG